jgi:hypothetical protein
VESVPLDLAAEIRSGVLCRRHADALSPPRGWWLDDRRDPTPQLFRQRPSQSEAGGPATVIEQTTAEPSAPRAKRRADKRPSRNADITIELLFDIAAVEEIGEVAAPDTEPGELPTVAADLPDPDETKAIPWSPHFDHSDDLGGLLNVRSPLLSRAFRGRQGSAER